MAGKKGGKTAKSAKPKKRRADAKPIRGFFAGMLSKDITLPAAIFDLLDNSLDGARRMKGDASLSGLWVRISATQSGFEIEDNCGGIRISVAEDYAFRFGRTDRARKILDFDHSTGQFGVGMKRAFFKLGTGFSVDSSSDEGRFKMKEDVSDWFTNHDADLDDWGFDIEVLSEGKIPTSRRGTKILVSPLHPTVADDFALRDFASMLRRDIAERYVVPLEEGLKISFNGAAVRPRAPSIIVGAQLAPTVATIEMDSSGHDVEPGADAAVTLRLLCGVADIEAPEAGWSVGLNSRMVLLADQTEAVGWSTRNGARIPAFHNQYGRFRGLALLDAEETTDLPWNTTKTLLDVDQGVYRRARREMVLAMEPVVKFLNRVKDERDEARRLEKDPESQPLHRLFDKPKQKSAIQHLLQSKSHRFSPDLGSGGAKAERSTTSIQFDISRRKVNRAKKELGVRSNAQVGEATFKFWWNANID